MAFFIGVIFMRFKELSKYRNAWLGFAMLWIMLYHSEIIFEFSVLNIIKSFGYGGVDICLFASGLGCYFSLNKNDDLLTFLSRRFSRLAPTYISFMVIWLSFHKVSSFQVILGNFLGIQNFTGLGNHFNWYISALILMYFLAPYFKKIIDRANSKELLLVLGFLIVVSIPFWRANTYIITVTRIPIFFIGMYVGKKCSEENSTITQKNIFEILSLMLIGIIFLLFSYKYYSKFLWHYGLHWYPFILITPGICLIISYIMICVENKKWLSWVKKGLDVIGINSFELYLLHIFSFTTVNTYIKTWDLKAYNNFIWIFTFLLLPILCMCFKLYVKYAFKIFKFFIQISKKAL